MANKNIRTLSARKGLDDNLFENISNLSKNAATEEEFHELSKRFLIDDSVVFGTSSFYDFLRPENKNKKIRVCNGTACMVAGTQNKLNKNLENYFKSNEIGHAACVGRCHSNNAFMYKDRTYSACTEDELDKIFSDTDKAIEQENEYAVSSNTTPILTSNIDDLSEFYELADMFSSNNETAIEEIMKSNLRGRGGAGFPYWIKLDTVFKENSSNSHDINQKYIVCNADEGDPGAYSDMYLMEHHPHKVLFGMYMSGLIVGADTGVLYIRGEYPDSIRIVNNAIDELKIMGLAKGFKFKIIQG